MPSRECTVVLCFCDDSDGHNHKCQCEWRQRRCWHCQWRRRGSSRCRRLGTRVRVLQVELPARVQAQRSAVCAGCQSQLRLPPARRSRHSRHAAGPGLCEGTSRSIAVDVFFSLFADVTFSLRVVSLYISTLPSLLPSFLLSFTPRILCSVWSDVRWQADGAHVCSQSWRPSRRP